MARYDRGRWRLAGGVRERLTARRGEVMFESGLVSAGGSYVTAACHRVMDLELRMTRARQRRMAGAMAVLRRRYETALHLLRQDTELQIKLAREPLPRPPALRQIMGELEAIEDEFGPANITFASEVIRVRTDRIELEEVDLGPFEIVLDVSELAWPLGPGPLRVVALEPNPAAGEQGGGHVTHPHVSDEHLCMGDAAGPIQLALAQGRLCDLFLVVRSVLNTYNPDSAYVRLDEWSGEPCTDCGLVVAAAEIGTCEACDRAFCDDCLGWCSTCDDATCHQCLLSCPGCDRDLCRPCARPCRGCGQRACPECISDHLCRACRSSNQSPKENNPDVNDPNHQPPGGQARRDEADAGIRPPVEAAAGP